MSSLGLPSNFVLQVAVAVVGGSVGIAIGVVGAAGIAAMADCPVLLRVEAILLAFGFAAAADVGLGSTSDSRDLPLPRPLFES